MLHEDRINLLLLLYKDWGWGGGGSVCKHMPSLHYCCFLHLVRVEIALLPVNQHRCRRSGCSGPPAGGTCMIPLINVLLDSPPRAPDV